MQRLEVSSAVRYIYIYIYIYMYVYVYMSLGGKGFKLYKTIICLLFCMGVKLCRSR
jgi:hypothetical protein